MSAQSDGEAVGGCIIATGCLVVGLLVTTGGLAVVIWLWRLALGG